MGKFSTMDEQVLKYREKYKRVTCTYDLEREQITIEGKPVSFERQEFGSRLSMMVPEDFKEIPEPMIKELFPAGDCPQIVKAGPRLAQVLTFHTLLGTPLEAEEEINGIQVDLNQLFPQNVFYTQGVEQAEEVQVHWFDFKHFAMDGEDYRFVFVFALEDKGGFLGTFRCSFATYDGWKPCLLAMLRSIVVVEENKEERNNA